jgi:hypothetical protein
MDALRQGRERPWCRCSHLALLGSSAAAGVSRQPDRQGYWHPCWHGRQWRGDARRCRSAASSWQEGKPDDDIRTHRTDDRGTAAVIVQDTFVIHQVVILGAEPMIVDTGTPANRQQPSTGAPTLYRTGAGAEGR